MLAASKRGIVRGEKEGRKRQHLRACVQKREDEGRRGDGVIVEERCGGCDTLGKLGVEGCKESPP